MEENTNVVNTSTTEKEGSKFGWGVLGFFIPLVGLILFLVWMKDKKRASKAAGIGALIGAGVGLLLFLLALFGIINIFSFGGSSVGTTDIQVVKATEKTNSFSIADSEYTLNWADNYITSDVARYNAVDEKGRKLFQLENVFIYNKDNSILSNKIITNTKDEILFDDLYGYLDSYSYYNFYYKNDIVIFNVGSNNTGYYFYDLNDSELYKAFVDDDSDNGGLAVSNISMDDESITFTAELTSEFNNYKEEKIYNKLMTGEYKTLNELKKDLEYYNLDEFIVYKDIKFTKSNARYKSEETKKTVVDIYNEKYAASTSTRTKECTGKVEVSGNKYVPIYDSKTYEDCKTIIYKLNDDFTIKYDYVENPNRPNEYYPAYNRRILINDNYSKDYDSIDAKDVYISGKTMIVGRYWSSTLSTTLINTAGEIYNYSDKNLLNIEGNDDTKFTIDENGDLIVEAIAYSNSGEIDVLNLYNSKVTTCKSSIDEVAAAYGKTPDDDVQSSYKFKLGADGLYDLNYSDKTTIKTIRDAYNKLCE